MTEKENKENQFSIKKINLFYERKSFNEAMIYMYFSIYTKRSKEISKDLNAQRQNVQATNLLF
jgi:hypothetical protein